MLFRIHTPEVRRLTVKCGRETPYTQITHTAHNKEEHWGWRWDTKTGDSNCETDRGSMREWAKPRCGASMVRASQDLRDRQVVTRCVLIPPDE